MVHTDSMTTQMSTEPLTDNKGAQQTESVNWCKMTNYKVEKKERTERKMRTWEETGEGNWQEW